MENKKQLPLRIGVGIVLLNDKNNVFVGKRIDNPKRIGSSCSADGCMDRIQFLFPMKDSENFEITAQIQVRNELNALIVVIDSKTINYTPHPIFEKILANYDAEIIRNEFGTFEVRKIIQKSKPMINSYFMDRTELFYKDYTILFAYNLAIPLESGDHITTEWLIKKKIFCMQLKENSKKKLE